MASNQQTYNLQKYAKSRAYNIRTVMLDDRYIAEADKVDGKLLS
jgi:hypothetical protein